MFEICHCDLLAAEGNMRREQGWEGEVGSTGGVKSLGRLHMGNSSSVICSTEQSEDVIP